MQFETQEEPIIKITGTTGDYEPKNGRGYKVLRGKKYKIILDSEARKFKVVED